VDEIVVAPYNEKLIKLLDFMRDNPGYYNPIYISGPSGIGKSFILKKYFEKLDNARIISSMDFEPEKVEEYLSHRFFGVEDLQLIHETKEIIRGFVSLIDHALEKDIQLVFTGDRPYEFLPLDPLITSRLDGGISIELPGLDPRSRTVLIAHLGKDLSPELREKIMEKDITNVRKLMGEIKKAMIMGTVEEEKREEVKREEKPVDDFSTFVESVKESIPEEIVETSEEERLREEYRQKLYVWEMKGFKTDRLKRAMEGKLEDLTREFVSFTTDVQRLIELQRRYGCLDVSFLTPEEMREIEEKLFDPDAVMELEEKISRLERMMERRKEYAKNLSRDLTLDTFKVTPSNQDAYEVLSHLLSSPLEGENPIVIVGSRGTGKTHLLNAFALELTKNYPNLLVAYLSYHTFLAEGDTVRTKYQDANILFIDDLHQIVIHGFSRNASYLISRGAKTGKRIIVGTERAPAFLPIAEEVKDLLQKGKVVYLQSPDPELKRIFIEKIASRFELSLSEEEKEEMVKKMRGGFYDIEELVEKILSGGREEVKEPIPERIISFEELVEEKPAPVEEEVKKVEGLLPELKDPSKRMTKEP